MILSTELTQSYNVGWVGPEFIFYQSRSMGYKFIKFTGGAETVSFEKWISNGWQYVAPKEMVVWNEV